MYSTPLSALQPLIDYCKQPGPAAGHLNQSRALAPVLLGTRPPGVATAIGPLTSAYLGTLRYLGTTFAGTLMSAPGLCGPTRYPNCSVIIALGPTINITVLFADVFADYLHTSEIDGTAAPGALFFSHQGTGYTLLLYEGGVIKAEEIVRGS